jgi:hypothetical protein
MARGASFRRAIVTLRQRETKNLDSGYHVAYLQKSVLWGAYRYNRSGITFRGTDIG